ncbi:carboxypeptidase regulatory-like domain-containing protein [Cochleicola gelatinilyticus]|uniref:Carboxypeptidase regulatory-like domain-containing protein n=1 Tax=Cochleicola gelatinilyticus TaxID=1763537 RepID=A0A167KBD0_9FLAO|nr:carboxypeptidase regulatory-like domain-containing protein [Cochleicola gelatinilyticus]OAB81687.1 hypothetical protein ULVI_00925 [Cochleicola gelatinilyticus]
MKKFLIICVIISSFGCKSVEYYHGVTVDETNQPLRDVKVIEDNVERKFVFTDSSGYFILTKNPNTVSRLVFEKSGFITDTVQTVWNRYDGAGKRFLNKKPDTIVIQRKK